MSVFSDNKAEMNGLGELTDEQVEELLGGFLDPDPVLGRFLARVRATATESVEADMAIAHVRLLAEAAHLASSSAPIAAKPRRNTGLYSPRRRENLTNLGRRLATRATAAGLATILIGGGVAAAATGNLPDPAQAAISNLAAQIGISIPNGDDLPEEGVNAQVTAANQALAEEMAAHAQQFAAAVHVAVGEYTTALDVWTDCVADNASLRGNTQSNSDTRTADAFDPVEACGAKPVLLIPDPASFGLGGSEHVWPPADPRQGPPGDAGSPADVPHGPPADAGTPSDVPQGPPEDSGSGPNLP